MIRGAIIICLVNYCAFLFSQQLSQSRNFESRKKNIPLEILNNHASHFYVLRLNNTVHDITVERRAKPGAEIVAFTPLKLDSINAGWFDYETLDHLFFEENNKVYFVFEKILNTKKSIYLKTIDSLGKTNGFLELASMERDNNSFDFEFAFKRTSGNNILIIASRYGNNGITRRTATLFDVHEKKIAWVKKLPLEISATEFSRTFECSAQNDLYYTRSKSVVVAYEAVYRDNIRYEVPILKLDSLFLYKWEHDSEFPSRVSIDAGEITNLKEASLTIGDSSLFLSLQGFNEYAAVDSVEALIVNAKLTRQLKPVFSKVTPYTDGIRKQLTFYDSPQKEYYTKDHRFISNYQVGSDLYTLSGRVEGYYHKELLLWKSDLSTGEVLVQKIIPRKIFFFRNRTRFKSIGMVMSTVMHDSLKLIMLENPGNFKKETDVYNYKELRKETKLYNANIVAYSLNASGRLQKKLIYRNSEFDLVPLKYESQGQADIVFYLNNNKYERFAILK